MPRGNNQTGAGRYSGRRKPRRTGPTRMRVDGLLKRIAGKLGLSLRGLMRIVGEVPKASQGQLIKRWRDDFFGDAAKHAS